ncbi:putative inactive purple acid phosphatase 27 [Acorus gramineus]|uniref:Inactive purple acid phosphatase 27 n=1 Tax=Acorus gramineus TaxID=55184 RepID=A0AAV9BQU0_ACOGR|nr:putative inactive purple acid phosphatase 27 [Acorus gramineus]
MEVTIFEGYTAISDFRILNRRKLIECPDINPYLSINVSSNSSGLSDDENITVTVSGVHVPDESDWIGMISPSSSDVSYCPLNSLLYKETGDLSDLPLLCHYPVKAQYVSNDPAYLSCKNEDCKEDAATNGTCSVKTCSGSVSFHVVNIRTDVEFVFFSGGFKTPCILKRSDPVKFANPNKPLYGHLSSIDSTGTSVVFQAQQKILDGMNLVASHVSYMTAIGNHERDFANSGSVYLTPDSGGECGVAYETYFQMPASGKDKPWYSIEQASVHFTIISTEHNWTQGSEQVDLVLVGHVHNYERTCAVFDNECKGMPKKDKDGIDTYDNRNYSAPVYAVIGMAGFKLDIFSDQASCHWFDQFLSIFNKD